MRRAICFSVIHDWLVLLLYIAEACWFDVMMVEPHVL